MKTMISRLTFFLLWMVGFSTANAQATLSMENQSFMAGEEKTVAINLDNEVGIKFIQMDIALPAGLEITAVKGVQDRMGRGQSVQANNNGGGKYRVMLASTNAVGVKGNSGAMFELTIKASGALANTSTIKVYDIEMSAMDETPIKPADFSVTVTKEVKLDGTAVFGVETNSYDITPGKTFQVNITLENTAKLCGLEGTLTLPAGLELVSGSDGLFDYSDRIPFDAAFSFPDGASAPTYKFALSSATNTVFGTGTGTFFSFTVKATEALARNTTITLSGLTVADPYANAFDLEDVVTVSVTNLAAIDQAAYEKLSGEIAALQEKLDAAINQVAEQAADVVAEFDDDAEAIQEKIDALQSALDAQHAAIALTDESALDAAEVKAVEDAISTMLTDAATAQQAYEATQANKAQNDKDVAAVADAQKALDDAKIAIAELDEDVQAGVAEAIAAAQQAIDDAAAAADASFKAGTAVADAEANAAAIAAAKAAAEKTLADAKAAQLAKKIYIEVDMTAQFPTDANGWGASEVGWAAPKVKTNDGREVAACEKYDASGVAATGVILTRTLKGLANGIYNIELYGAAAYTSGRGFESDLVEGDETAVYLFAETPAGTVKKFIPAHVADNFNGTGLATAKLENVEVTDGNITIGMYKDKPLTNWHVIQIKGVTALVDAEEALALAVANAEAISEESVPAALYAELQQVVADNNKSYKTGEEYKAAIEAIDAVVAKASRYPSVKGYLDKMEAVLSKTNVYTDEAYAANYGDVKAAYEAGTLADADFSEYTANSAYSNGWHAANKVDDVLLSAWTIGEKQCKDYDAGLYINTWSVEGDNDGSEFKTPFFEYWTNDDKSLGEQTLTATLTGLKPGVYKATVNARVRIKDGAEAPATGISFQVNDGETTNVADGAQVGTSQFYLKSVETEGIVSEDGTLNIKFNVAADNNISWLSFKDVNYEFVGAIPEPEPKYVYVDLTPDMFMEWDGVGADAEIVNENIDCAYALNTAEPLGGGAMVYGNASVLCKQYADVTGAASLRITGTPGMQFRVLLNRKAVGDGGGDANGGALTELNPTIGESGYVDVDFSSYEFVHINAIKTNWGSSAGTITDLKLAMLAEVPEIALNAPIFNFEEGTQAEPNIQPAGSKLTINWSAENLEENLVTEDAAQVKMTVMVSGDLPENMMTMGSTTAHRVMGETFYVGLGEQDFPVELKPGYVYQNIAIMTAELVLPGDEETPEVPLAAYAGEPIQLHWVGVAAEEEQPKPLLADVKMTYVDFDQADVAIGEVTEAKAGFNKVANDEVGLGNTSWGCNWITYVKVDASKINGTVVGAKMKAEVSGTIDANKRVAVWGVGYNKSTWSADLTYNTADKSIIPLGDTYTTTSKNAETFENVEFDITEAFKDGAKTATILVYETAAAGGWIKNVSVELDVLPGAPEIANASFEEDGEQATSNGPLTLTGWTFEGVGTSFNNTELRAAGSESTTSQFGTSVPSNGEYSLFFRQGWNGDGNIITITSSPLAEIPAGDYTLSIDYKQRYSYDNTKNDKTTVGISLINGEYTVASETSPAAEGVQGGSTDGTYFNDTEWSTVTTSFSLTEAMAAGAQVVITLNAGGQRRSDYFLDNVQLVKVPGVELALVELQKAIEAAEAKKGSYAVGESLFQYPSTEIQPLADAIATAQAAYEAAESKEAVETATQAINSFVENFEPTMATPDASKQYTLSLTTSDGSFELNVAESGITIAEEGTPVYLVAQEDGSYAIYEESAGYVNYAGSDRWTMTASEDAYGWTITALPDGGYTIAGQNGLLGTNNNNGNAADSPCYGDKNTGNGNCIWTIEEVVEPEPEIVEVDLTDDMFHQWDGVGADAQIIGSVPNIGFEKKIGETAEGGNTIYGNGSVWADHYAALAGYEYLTITFSGEGTPRFLFGRSENNSSDYIEVASATSEYVEVSEDGQTWKIDLNKIKEAKGGLANLNVIKANWGQPVTVSSIKLGKIAGDEPDAIFGIEKPATAKKNGKIFESGRVVIYRNGKKFSTTGVELK